MYLSLSIDLAIKQSIYLSLHLSIYQSISQPINIHPFGHGVVITWDITSGVLALLLGTPQKKTVCQRAQFFTPETIVPEVFPYPEASYDDTFGRSPPTGSLTPGICPEAIPFPEVSPVSLPPLLPSSCLNTHLYADE